MKTLKHNEWTVDGMNNVVVTADAALTEDDVHEAVRFDGRVLADIEPPPSKGAGPKGSRPRSAKDKYHVPALFLSREGVAVVQERYYVLLPVDVGMDRLKVAATLLRIAVSTWSVRSVH